MYSKQIYLSNMNVKIKNKQVAPRMNIQAAAYKSYAQPEQKTVSKISG